MYPSLILEEQVKTKDPTITTNIIKWIILEHYNTPENSRYKLELFTRAKQRYALSYINKRLKEKSLQKGSISYNRKSKINCNECNKEIIVNNLVVSNKHSGSRKKYYHFKCALLKQFVEEKTIMHIDYKKYLEKITI